jgi:hypothetical protein
MLISLQKEKIFKNAPEIEFFEINKLEMDVV